jgi:DNA-binding CsgD family transcriptional regulator
MSSNQKLTHLIGHIYDATLDPSLWHDVLDDTAHFVGGSAAVLISKDPTARRVCLFHEAGADPHYLDLYRSRYAALDPLTIGHYFGEIEQPIAVADLLPYDDFLQTQFYKEWVRPQGLVDFVGAALDKSATDVAMLGIFRHERDGVADETTRQCMRVIVPHIRRAMMISRAVDSNQAEARTLKDAFDGFGAGAFLIDVGGRLVHANAAGHEILNAGELVRVIDGRLMVADAEGDKTLRATLASAAQSTGTDVAVALSDSDGGRYVAHILPLAAEHSRFGRGPRAAAAAMFVRKASLEGTLRPEIIARTYRLTPAELRVLLAMVEEGGVREVSESLGVAETTIKTHLSRLFEKTGAGRQADLIKLVAGYASPLAGRA